MQRFMEEATWLAEATRRQPCHSHVVELDGQIITSYELPLFDTQLDEIVQLFVLYSTGRNALDRRCVCAMKAQKH